MRDIKAERNWRVITDEKVTKRITDEIDAKKQVFDEEKYNKRKEMIINIMGKVAFEPPNLIYWWHDKTAPMS